MGAPCHWLLVTNLKLCSQHSHACMGLDMLIVIPGVSSMLPAAPYLLWGSSSSRAVQALTRLSYLLAAMVET